MPPDSTKVLPVGHQAGAKADPGQKGVLSMNILQSVSDDQRSDPVFLFV